MSRRPILPWKTMKVGQRWLYTGSPHEPIAIRQVRASTLAVYHGKKLNKKFGTMRIDGSEVWIVRKS